LAGRPYRLLAGLRRASHWTAIGPMAFDAALHSLRQAFSLVVADVTGDFDGEAETGSVDLEERNHMARAVVAQAAAVVVVGVGGPTGHRALETTIEAVQAHVGDAAGTIRVVNRADTTTGPERAGPGGRDGAAIHLGHLGPLHHLDELLPWAGPATDAVAAMLETRPGPPSRWLTVPAPVLPGTVGQWRGAR
jgi:hypothetical protein